jgi:hypothetical protein
MSAAIERLVVTIRLYLDYPNQEDRRAYLAAVEALDKLAILARVGGDPE